MLCPACGSTAPPEFEGIGIACPIAACPVPDTLALTMRQSLVATDNAGRAKSCNTLSGRGAVGASGDAGSAALAGGVALSAPMAGAALAPHSDSATGMHQACRRKHENVIERLVVLAMPDGVAR
ncbi:hypothetical protein [Pandoraea sp. ISTKB]|uniref:hypothetical protein n=1 Tax=Pandoraea sp. ISTKB TaxID=1586708 RepID=UPI00084698DE|nr:hypothetical protein [Pandoraea sp. ISTKB]ODP32623.1 hypothetical protein A9762_22320 [Pandoraea sp. ISTKB]